MQLQMQDPLCLKCKSAVVELSSNMSLCYAYGNNIYSLSSITTYVFLVWQTYFVFCIYANSFGNCTHMYIMPMKC